LNSWIYTKNSKQLLVPASNTKIITTFSIYSLLGENYKLTTSVVTDGVIKDCEINGNVYIVGGGDALLSVNDIESISDEIRKMGIKKINGNIYGDGSMFDNLTNRWTYSGDRDEVESTAPITALALDRNIVKVIITSGSVAGKPVNVQFSPASSAFSYQSSAKVAGGNSNSKNNNNGKIKTSYNQINNFYFDDVYDVDFQMAGDKKKINKSKSNSKKVYSNPISVTTKILENGKQTFFINGNLPPNRTYSYKHYISRPALAVAAVLKDRLKAGGIEIKGDIAEKAFPTNENKTKMLLFSFQRNISDMIYPTNKNSDNYLAEMLFKIIGATANKDSNTAKSASIAELQNLTNIGINTNGFVFNDGSGLSRRNNISAEGIVNILLYANNKSFGNDFFNSFSIAGIDGTLGKRMQNSLATNNLIAKTGTHGNVSSLAGMVQTKSGDELFFSFIFNGGSVGYYKSLENLLGMKLAEY
jgi:D-alanyl-D-alanine carboxypeptidase/D-alanyl-D-alanine-endopeptidase (penicillin-binding protein 4)